MAKLLDLSNELLIAVLAASPDILTALSLSGANWRLRGIWLEHADIIIEGIIRPNIPAYNDALVLVKGELLSEQLSRHPIDDSNSLPSDSP